MRTDSNAAHLEIVGDIVRLIACRLKDQYGEFRSEPTETPRPTILTTTKRTTAAETPGLRRAIPLRPLWRATAWFRTISGQPQFQYHFRDANDELRLSVGIDLPRRLSEWPKRWQQLAILCLQLALAEDLSAECGKPPWIFTDRSLTLPRRASQRLFRRLASLAEADQQILLMTSNSQLAHHFQQLHLVPCVVSPQTYVPTEPPVVEPAQSILPLVPPCAASEVDMDDTRLDDMRLDRPSHHRRRVSRESIPMEIVEVAYERAG